MADGILVLGAGELGTAVLEALARHPKRGDTKIAVLLRGSSSAADPARAQLLQHLRDDLHVHFETADVVAASVADLAAVFERYHTVVSCNGMGLPAGTQTKLSQAVLQARVPRYVPWQFGMDYDAIGAGSTQDLFDEQLAVRALLRSPNNATTDWIIVSTGLFMSFLFLAAFGVVDLPQRTVRGLGQWDNRITVTTPADIGTVTADVLLDPQGIQRQVVYVAGDTVSYSDVADLLDAHYATTFKRELWDLGALQQQVAANPNDTMVKYRDTFAQGRGVAWDKDITVNAQRHIPMRDVKQYIQGFDKL
ncbi:hypothetical protein HMPREF1624_06568 [Sporothrix schenckii ATCC 58251]|uniref:NmrA-like domain-containing protein n=1 Tax=Sporothrix schenckii (strain ATCC 58251 / de Perez 2211183) TaxID=1391915 RepID=U7PNS1_SPOS1|nr:hypothetical protein HMPREF1624_06568 [Sporothrix schenckii ATCC 58251]